MGVDDISYLKFEQIFKFCMKYYRVKDNARNGWRGILSKIIKLAI